MALYYAHLTNGDDLPVHASVDLARMSKAAIFRELERALLKQYGPNARGLKVGGYASCDKPL